MRSSSLPVRSLRPHRARLAVVPAAWVATVAAGSVTALLLLELRRLGLFRADQVLRSDLNVPTGALHTVAGRITELGSPNALLLAAAATLLYSWWRRDALVAAYVAIAVGGAVTSSEAIKALTGRLHPFATGGYGSTFPSGHMASATAICLAAATLIGLELRSRSLRQLVWAVVLAAAAMVGWSRLALDTHWVIDVIGGLVMAGSWWALAGYLTGLDPPVLDRPAHDEVAATA